MDVVNRFAVQYEFNLRIPLIKFNVWIMLGFLLLPSTLRYCGEVPRQYVLSSG